MWIYGYFECNIVRCHVVQARGLEPPCSCEHTDLNRARLPIPPCLRDRNYYNIGYEKMPQLF
jgi:hypothetical protein